MNSLKDKIQNERLSFDEETPPTGHEERFLAKLDEESSSSNKLPWLKIAAGLIVIIGLALFFSQMSETIDDNSGDMAKNEDSSIPMDEAEYYYKQSFTNQFNAIAKNYTDQESLAMIKESELLIGNLQEEYIELEKELETSGDERVATAMILNYKSRISILEKLIEKLEYVNRIKSQTNEKLNS